jgi:hypothetical protein
MVPNLTRKKWFSVRKRVKGSRIGREEMKNAYCLGKRKRVRGDNTERGESEIRLLSN